MADPKDPDQCIQQYNTTEIPGVLNSWQPNQARYTNQMLGEAAGTNFSQQIQSSLIRNDKNRLQGINNRTAICIATGSLSSFEHLIYDVATPTNNDAAPKASLKKAYTRCAESKTYFLTAPWNYDDSPMAQYEAAIMEGLHTYSIEPDFDLQLGSFYTQIYEDESQSKAKILAKIKEGFDDFPSVKSSQQFFITKDGSLFLSTTSENAGKLVTTGTTLPNGTPAFKEGTLVQAVKNSGWSPDYNPCAVLAPVEGTKPVRPKASIGKQRTTFGNQGERADFGPRIHPTKGTKQFHQGQDMSTQGGFPIVSVYGGQVTRIKMDNNSRTTGQEQPKTTANCYITIKHDTNDALEKQKIEIHTTYMHLLKIALNPTQDNRLQVGDTIKSGQVIGFMGGGRGWPGSGFTTGPHLHFEIGLRKMKSDGTYNYDTYTPDDGKVYLKSGGSMGLGAVDPLFFRYPNLATFSNDKETRDLINSFIPTKAEQEINKKQSLLSSPTVLVAAAATNPLAVGPVLIANEAVNYWMAPSDDEGGE